MCYASLCLGDERGESTYSLALLSDGGALGAGLLLRLALLQEGLRDQDVVVGRDSAIGKLRLVRSPAYRVCDGMEQSAGARTVAEARHSVLWLTRSYI